MSTHTRTHIYMYIERDMIIDFSAIYRILSQFTIFLMNFVLVLGSTAVMP